MLETEKIENGVMLVEWYRQGAEIVFRRAYDDETMDALVRMVGTLQSRLDRAEQLLRAAVVHVEPD